MGRSRPRYNEKARASSASSKNARPHPSPRHGGVGKKTKKTTKPLQQEPNLPVEATELVNYIASDTSVPTLLPAHAEKSKEPKVLNMPEGKVSAKKRKRLEKFIEHALKKEERVKLIDKLSKQQFSSDLLMSSKAIGHKQTAREKATHAARGGAIEKTEDFTGDVPEEEQEAEGEEGEKEYVTDCDDEGGDEEEGYGDYEDGADDGNESDPPSKRVKVNGPSPASNATSAPPPRTVTVEVVDHSNGTMTSSLVEQPVILVKPLPTFGSALKKPASSSLSTSQPPTPPTTKNKKPKQKRAIVIKDTESDDESSSSSGSESERANTTSVTVPALSSIMKKGVWMSDVVVGEKLSSVPSGLVGISGPPAPSTPETQPLVAATIPLTSTTTQQPSAKAFYISLPRPEALAVARLALPVSGEEQPIMESINANDVTIICGATGSGKTTQVPQFLLEAGFGDPRHPQYPGMIGITQPRRVAAVSVAKRVAEETGLMKGEIGYQIRYDSSTVKAGITRVKFMTDGILLRELSSAATRHQEESEGGEQKHLGGRGGKSQSKQSTVEDLLLLKYSCIIVDEAHERTVGTDVLIGWLARIARLRNSGKLKGVHPLKLVVMSATLRVQDFAENTTLFPSPPPLPTKTNPSTSISTFTSSRPPVINVEGRQYKVTIHYNRRTPETDYIGEAFKKICKVHSKLPSGGILVFMTGQGEIQALVNKLRKKFPASSQMACERDRLVEANDQSVPSNLFEEVENEKDEGDVVDEEEAIPDRDDYRDEDDEDSEEEDVDVLDGESDGEGDDLAISGTEVEDGEKEAAPLHVLPLYSLLSTQAQLRIFEAPPPGSRLCVIATNVAETSLTIPNIRYVIDTGKVKERRYDSRSGTQTFSVGWTSKASADQRAGRAGRVGVGHCYRLFSSAVFNDRFDEFSEPQIVKTPVEGVVLQMKAMGIHQVVNFPFPTPPNRESLRSAEKLLVHLGALDSTHPSLRATELGRLMAQLPVSPRYAKMLAVAVQQSSSLLEYTIAMVAGMSTGDPFIRDEDILQGNVSHSEEDEEEESNDLDSDERERKIKKRRDYYRVMQMFSGDSKSDALRLLFAIGAHAMESTQSSSTRSLEKFCESHFLRSKAMSESSQLRRQLTTIIKSELSSHPNVKDLIVNPRMVPPTSKDAQSLRQIIFAGFPDRVARLEDEAGEFIRKNEKSGWPTYRIMWRSHDDGGTEEIAQIHPSSSLFAVRPPPKFIVYEEVVGREERVAIDGQTILPSRAASKAAAASALVASASTPSSSIGEATILPTSTPRPLSTIFPLTTLPPKPPTPKVWLKGCTALSEAWISALGPPSLLTHGAILEAPEPRYDATQDVMVGFASARYGPKAWELPIHQVRLDVGVRRAEAYVWFAKELLQGHVALSFNSSESGGEAKKKRMKGADGKRKSESIMGGLSQYLVAKPSIVTKPWARVQPRVANLLAALTSAQVSSRESLLRRWQEEPAFLLKPLQLWYPPEVYALLKQSWPPVMIETDVTNSSSIASAKAKTELLQLIKKIAGEVGGRDKAVSGGNNGRRDDGSDYDSDF